MGGTQILVLGIYREKIPRYMIYRSTCFLPFSPKFGQFLNSQSKNISNWSSLLCFIYWWRDSCREISSVYY